MTVGNPDLMRLLRRELAQQGKITFARYMHLAVHHPQHGYYAKGRPIIGPDGDFMTAPALHQSFGQTLWRQVREMLDLLPPKEPFRLLEIGAGGGHMARDLLLAARADGWPPHRLQYAIVEQSSRLQQQQRRFITTAWPQAPVVWLPTVDAAHGVHVVLMNELMSAFAVHRLLQNQQGQWQELYVTLTDNGLDYVPGPVSEPAAVAMLKEANVTLAPGQIADVNLGAGPMLATIAATLAPQAFVVTIDYGGPASYVYDANRPRGSSLRCYYRQQRLASPFVRPGEQDITADLDFDMMVRIGQKLGLDKVGLLHQGPFLVNLGIDELAAHLARAARQGDLAADVDLQKVYGLYAPEGLGESFWVLVQSRGFQPPPPLRGFQQTAPPTPTLLQLLQG